MPSYADNTEVSFDQVYIKALIIISKIWNRKDISTSKIPN